MPHCASLPDPTPPVPSYTACFGVPPATDEHMAGIRAETIKFIEAFDHDDWHRNPVVTVINGDRFPDVRCQRVPVPTCPCPCPVLSARQPAGTAAVARLCVVVARRRRRGCVRVCVVVAAPVVLVGVVCACVVCVVCVVGGG